MAAPDFPMNPPTRDAWHSMRSATWPAGTSRGGGGCLDLDRFAALPLGFGSAIRGRLEGGERNVWAINDDDE